MQPSQWRKEKWSNGNLIKTRPRLSIWEWLIGANAEKLVPQACLVTLINPRVVKLPQNGIGPASGLIPPATSGSSMSVLPWQASDKVRPELSTISKMEIRL